MIYMQIFATVLVKAKLLEYKIVTSFKAKLYRNYRLYSYSPFEKISLIKDILI